MRISRITIENYRSIRHISIEPTNFNIFVGRNNQGKTNLFQAIQWFYSPSGQLSEYKNSSADEAAEVVVELEFDNVQHGLNQISHKDNQTKLKNVLGASDTMRVRRSSENPKDRLLFSPSTEEWKKQPCGSDGPFNNCIPRFEFVEATKHLKDVGNYKSTTPIGKMLGGVLTEILEGDETYVDFRRQFEELFSSERSRVRKKLREVSDQVRVHLQKQFPDCTDVDFIVEEPAFDDLLKNFYTQIDDGVRTPAEFKGDGMQRALMLAIINTYADQRRVDALGRSFIFFLDEAELHLHPTAQRQLKQALLELADGHDQIFINTHSSVLLTDEHTLQSVFRVQKEDRGNTFIEKVSTHRHKHEVVFELLGGSPADLLLPANFLVVEGPSEAEFLKQVIGRHYPDRPAVHVLPARGDDDRQRQIVTAVDDLLQTLGRRAIYRERLVIIFDRPNGLEKRERLTRFLHDRRYLERNNQVFELPVEALEDYYPERLRREVDVTNKVKLAHQIGRRITRGDFEEQMPVLYGALESCWQKAYGD